MSCNCCRPGASAHPARENPPGRTGLSYRIGTWSSFRRAMVSSLSLQVVPPDGGTNGRRPLAALTSRAADEPTIALIDAFACVCDVLTFYQERILNEGYLTTATQQLSVTELATAIGYEPAPGVAANAWLAFTVDANRETEVAVPVGHAVQSIPAEPGELPVIFETDTGLTALAEWNVLRPKATRVHPIGTDTRRLYLKGIDTRLLPGAPIVVVGAERRDEQPGAADVSERWDLRWVEAIAPDAARGFTVVTLDRGLGGGQTEPAAAAIEVLTFTDRGSLFGWNAPDVRMMSEDVRNNAELVANESQWVRFSFDEDLTRAQVDTTAVDLDREYPAVVVGGWVCLQSSTEVELYRVSKVNPASRTEFSMTAKVTRVFVDSAEHLDSFSRRGTTVLLGSRSLPIAEEPDPDPVSGATVELAAPLLAALPKGRPVLVTGVAVGSGEPLVIPTTIKDWDDGGPLPVVTFEDPLPSLVRDTVQILANVTLASHGQSVPNEVLGSGDAGAAGQQFRLGHAPLTWVARPPTGAESTVALRVNGLSWDRVDTLYTAAPDDRVYTLRLDHDGSTIVRFGDGVRGARPPSGTENIAATYRKGIGLSGQVGAGQLALLVNRPPGLAAVTNPAPSGGAADPDQLEQIRLLAPRTVLTLDRLVSLQDYEDEAAAFPGIGKSLAVDLWDGRRGFVHLTVATASGGVLASTDPTRIALSASIDARRDPAHHVIVDGHLEVRFGVTMRVLVDPAYRSEDVLAAVRTALATAFSFATRRFGQPTTSAEVVTAAQEVPGVIAVDLDRFVRSDGRTSARGVLPAAIPRWDGTAPTRAEVLVLGPDLADCELNLMEDR